MSDLDTSYVLSSVRNAREMPAEAVFAQAELDAAPAESAAEQAINGTSVLQAATTTRDIVDIATTTIDGNKEAVTVSENTLGTAMRFIVNKHSGRSSRAAKDANMEYPGPGKGSLNLDTDDLFSV